MSISTTTVTGSSETTARTLQNPSATDPIRIDYFSRMMRKWHVAVYRYGLRLTYDIGIPEPGGTLREAYMKLDGLQAQARALFTFPIKYWDISTDPVDPATGAPSAVGVPKWYWLAIGAGAQVSPPPEPQILTVGGNQVSGLNDINTIVTWPLNFTVQDGYWIDDIWLYAYLMPMDTGGAFSVGPFLDILGWPTSFTGPNMPNTNLLQVHLGKFMWHSIGAQTITWMLATFNPATITFQVTINPTDSTWQQWQASSVWSALYNAARPRSTHSSRASIHRYKRFRTRLITSIHWRFAEKKTTRS